MKTATVREVYEALEKNGFEHLRGSWFIKNEDGVVIGGCILAQTGVNLGVLVKGHEGVPPERYGELDNTLTRHTFDLLSQLNRFWVSEEAPKFSHSADGNGLGDQIVRWNDAVELGFVEKDGFLKKVYVLKTYEEVAAVARELMEPFFDETVELIEFDWKVPERV